MWPISRWLATRTIPSPRLFSAAVWLAVVLVVVKASYLGIPGALPRTADAAYLRSLAAISYVDVMFAVLVWASGRAVLSRRGTGRPRGVSSRYPSRRRSPACTLSRTS